MNETLLYSMLEILGVIIFASEGLFIKDVELHPLIGVLLTYTVYAIISFIILAVKGEINMTLLQKLVEPRFLIVNFANILKTGGIFMGFKFLPVSFAIVLKMMGPAFLMIGNSILNNKAMPLLQIIGIITSVVMICLIYRKSIMSAFKNINVKFFIGVLGIFICNATSAYNIIKLPEYVTDKDPHEEIFLSTVVAFATLLSIVTGIFFTKRKMLGSISFYNILKMIVVFTITCYGGMSLTYAADNHLDPMLYSTLQYSQLILAFFIGYFFEGDKFPLSRIILVVIFLMSVIFTLKVSQPPVKKDKRKIITNATLFHSEEKKS
jgi:drug/metabolite transporter (DMT)-like permease